MKQKGKMSGKKLKQMFVTYTFVLPDFIGLLVFIIIPIIYSFYMSLYDWNFANIKQFIGIQNYVTMFSDSEWWQSLGRTFKLTLLYVPALFILSILFAVLINYVKNEKAAVQALKEFSQDNPDMNITQYFMLDLDQDGQKEVIANNDKNLIVFGAEDGAASLIYKKPVFEWVYLRGKGLFVVNTDESYNVVLIKYSSAFNIVPEYCLGT